MRSSSVMNQSVLNHTAFHSVIGENSVLAPKSEKSKKSIVADLLLTALIDAFSILVIFLLMSFSSTGEILFLGKNMELPKARMGEALERNPVIKVDSGKIFLEEQEVSHDKLVEALLALRQKYTDTHPGEEFPAMVTIQGDRRLKYEVLNSIVLASSQAGFSDIKFAIVMK